MTNDYTAYNDIMMQSVLQCIDILQRSHKLIITAEIPRPHDSSTIDAAEFGCQVGTQLIATFISALDEAYEEARKHTPTVEPLNMEPTLNGVALRVRELVAEFEKMRAAKRARTERVQ